VSERGAARRTDIAVRLLIAHGLAYPVAIAWAFGSIPLTVAALASAVGTTLDDDVVAHRVLLTVAWPAVASFVLVHASGAFWALSPDARRGRRVWVASMLVLGILPVVGGGASWIWLMGR
jgi:hypothetical protein